MSKIKDFILLMLGSISALFYMLNKSKSKQVERHKKDAEKYKKKASTQEYIAKEERRSKDDKETIARSNESDLDELLNKTGSYRD